MVFTQLFSNLKWLLSNQRAPGIFFISQTFMEKWKSILFFLIYQYRTPKIFQEIAFTKTSFVINFNFGYGVLVGLTCMSILNQFSLAK